MSEDKALATVDEESISQLVRRVMFKGVPDDMVKVALILCARYDLDPLLKHLVIIVGKKGTNVYVTRDGLLHVAHKSGQLNGMQTTYGKDDIDEYAECTVWRKDMEQPFKYRVYRGEYDTKQYAWQTHPRAMLTKTAEVFCLRRAFDVAITPVEEMDAVIDGDVIHGEAITEEPPPGQGDGKPPARLSQDDTEVVGDARLAPDVPHSPGPPKRGQPADGIPVPSIKVLEAMIGKPPDDTKVYWRENILAWYWQPGDKVWKNPIECKNSVIKHEKVYPDELPARWDAIVRQTIRRVKERNQADIEEIDAELPESVEAADEVAF